MILFHIINLRNDVVIAFKVAGSLSDARPAATIGRAERLIVSSLHIPVNFLWIHGALHVRDLPLPAPDNRSQAFFPLFEKWVVYHPLHFILHMRSQTLRPICFSIAYSINRFSMTLSFLCFGAICLLSTGG